MYIRPLKDTVKAADILKAVPHSSVTRTIRRSPVAIFDAAHKYAEHAIELERKRRKGSNIPEYAPYAHGLAYMAAWEAGRQYGLQQALQQTQEKK